MEMNERGLESVREERARALRGQEMERERKEVVEEVEEGKKGFYLKRESREVYRDRLF